MQVALYLVSADRRDDVADGRVLGREGYCHDATETAASFALALARLTDRHVVRVGDVALRLVEDAAWPETDGGRVLTPSGWRELTAAELSGFRCRTDGCTVLAADSTGPALLCEACADARYETECRERYETELAAARERWPHACCVCLGSGFVSYGHPDGPDSCDCVAAGVCPRCARAIEQTDDDARCAACGWAESDGFNAVLPCSPF